MKLEILFYLQPKDLESYALTSKDNARITQERSLWRKFIMQSKVMLKDFNLYLYHPRLLYQLRFSDRDILKKNKDLVPTKKGIFDNYIWKMIWFVGFGIALLALILIGLATLALVVATVILPPLGVLAMILFYAAKIVISIFTFFADIISRCKDQFNFNSYSMFSYDTYPITSREQYKCFLAAKAGMEASDSWDALIKSYFILPTWTHYRSFVAGKMAKYMNNADFQLNTYVALLHYSCEKNPLRKLST